MIYNRIKINLTKVNGHIDQIYIFYNMFALKTDKTRRINRLKKRNFPCKSFLRNISTKLVNLIVY